MQGGHLPLMPLWFCHLCYPMITNTPLVSSNLPIRTSVARRCGQLRAVYCIVHNNNYGDCMWYYVSKWVCGVMLLVHECVRGYNKL